MNWSPSFYLSTCHASFKIYFHLAQVPLCPLKFYDMIISYALMISSALLTRLATAICLPSNGNGTHYYLLLLRYTFFVKARRLIVIMGIIDFLSESELSRLRSIYIAFFFCTASAVP